LTIGSAGRQTALRHEIDIPATPNRETRYKHVLASTYDNFLRQVIIVPSPILDSRPQRETCA